MRYIAFGAGFKRIFVAVQVIVGLDELSVIILFSLMDGLKYRLKSKFVVAGVISVYARFKTY